MIMLFQISQCISHCIGLLHDNALSNFSMHLTLDRLTFLFLEKKGEQTTFKFTDHISFFLETFTVSKFSYLYLGSQMSGICL